VTNGYLKGLYRKWNDNVVIRPNMHNDSLFGWDSEWNGNNTVGFRGTRRVHEWNIAAFMEAFAVEADRIFWGSDMWLLPGKHIPEKMFLDYMVNFKKNAPGIVFKPLIEIPHNFGKSNCAWIEATWAGGVLLGPDWDEWHKPGIVNYRSPKDAAVKLRELLNDDDMRRENFEKSFKYIKENLLVSNVVFRPEDYKL
jgi:hypothetical protein